MRPLALLVRCRFCGDHRERCWPCGRSTVAHCVKQVYQPNGRRGPGKAASGARPASAPPERVAPLRAGRAVTQRTPREGDAVERRCSCSTCTLATNLHARARAVCPKRPLGNRSKARRHSRKAAERVLRAKSESLVCCRGLLVVGASEWPSSSYGWKTQTHNTTR